VLSRRVESMPQSPSAAGANDALYRRVAFALIPFLFVCYVVAMVDRLNVGYAKLQFMADLHFDESVFGMAAGALYVGYILFEVPSNLMLERVGLAVTMLRIMTLWGVFTMAMALAADRWSFYAIRFMIGVAEAGFFPGVLFYLTLWFPNAWRARITSLFALAVPLSGVLAAPLSSAIMTGMAGFAGLMGWRWLFLPDRPAAARFLSDDEKRAIAADLAAEAARTAAYGDRSDNAEYKQAKGNLRHAHWNILSIEDQIKRAILIPSGLNASGTVRLGSTVILEANEKQKKFEILGPHETDPTHGRISHESPLGAALIGHGHGDVVRIKTEKGFQEYRILEIR